jgi:hypothetical protein
VDEGSGSEQNGSALHTTRADGNERSDKYDSEI